MSKRAWRAVEKQRGRISILLPDMRPGGAERLHLQLAEQWLHAGRAVDFVLRNANGELLAKVPKGAGIIDLNADRVRNSLVPLARYLRNAHPSVLIAAMWPLTIIAPLAARMAGFRGRVAISEHSPLSIAYRGKGKAHAAALRISAALGYRLADVRIGVSSGVADDMARIARLSRDRFDVVYNPAASGRVPEQKPARPDLLREVSGPILLSVGTLKAVKRHDLLIDAFARLPRSLDATLCILGEGAQRASLERRIAELGLEGRVLLPGYVADPMPWYAHADQFVLSSDYEGFGNVIVEAMEHGVPVVSTDCPVGPAEILQGGQYGKLVPVGNADALAEAIEQSLSTLVDRNRLKARARDFDVGRVAQRYLDLLLPERGAAA